MPQSSAFRQRFLYPVGRLLIVMWASYFIFKQAWKIEQPLLHNDLSIVFGLILFLSLGVGPYYVYRRAFDAGAFFPGRVAAAFFCPMTWVAKEIYVLTGVYSVAESLYFIINPVQLLLYSAVIAEIGLGEIVSRRKTGRPGSFPAWLAVLLGVASIVFLFGWDLGVHHFYAFQEGYKALFGTGLH